MVNDSWQRTQWLIGQASLQRLQQSSVAVFGLGGVGSFAAEALARSGIGRLILVDHDRIAASNLNRQLIATCDTLGTLKVESARKRLQSINPDLVVQTHATFWSPQLSEDEAAAVLKAPVDYVVDAVDTVSAKIDLVLRADKRGIPVISCMGTGNKLDPSQLVVTDLFSTQVCPLARVMRRELRRRQISSLRVVYSPENPQRQTMASDPASMIFVPGSAGLLLASQVVRDLLGELR